MDVARGSTIVAVTGSGSVVGFGCRRPCIQEGYHEVGPLYAEDGAIAEAILAKLCSEVAWDYVSMDIWYIPFIYLFVRSFIPSFLLSFIHSLID